MPDLPANDSTRPATIVDLCNHCGATIALKPPQPRSIAVAWLCNKCGAVYFAAEDETGQTQGLTRAEPRNEQSALSAIPLSSESATSAPPEVVQRLVTSLTGHETGAERRHFKRHPVTIPVVALPLSSDFRVQGEPVQMTTANISLGGAALIHTRFVDAPYFALDFTAEGFGLFQVVLKVLRVRGIGPVYEIAGQFISRLSMSSSADERILQP